MPKNTELSEKWLLAVVVVGVSKYFSICLLPFTCYLRSNYCNFMSWAKNFRLNCINDSAYQTGFTWVVVSNVGKLNARSVIWSIIIFQVFFDGVLLFWFENVFSLSNHLSFHVQWSFSSFQFSISVPLGLGAITYAHNARETERGRERERANKIPSHRDLDKV